MTLEKLCSMVQARFPLIKEGSGKFRILQTLLYSKTPLTSSELNDQADISREHSYKICKELEEAKVIHVVRNRIQKPSERSNQYFFQDVSKLEKEIVSIAKEEEEAILKRISWLNQRLTGLRKMISRVELSPPTYLARVDPRLQGIGPFRAALSVLHAIEIVRLTRKHSFEGQLETGITSKIDFYQVQQGTQFNDLHNDQKIDQLIAEYEFQNR